MSKKKPTIIERFPMAKPGAGMSTQDRDAVAIHGLSTSREVRRRYSEDDYLRQIAFECQHAIDEYVTLTQ